MKIRTRILRFLSGIGGTILFMALIAAMGGTAHLGRMPGSVIDGHFTPPSSHQSEGAVEMEWIAGFHSSKVCVNNPIAVVYANGGSSVAVTGMNGGRQIVTIAYEATGGKRLWTARYGQPWNGGGFVAKMEDRRLPIR